MEEKPNVSKAQDPTAEYFAEIAGQPINKSERATQNRVVKLFESLGYSYLGNLQDSSP